MNKILAWQEAEPENLEKTYEVFLNAAFHVKTILPRLLRLYFFQTRPIELTEHLIWSIATSRFL